MVKPYYEGKKPNGEALDFLIPSIADSGAFLRFEELGLSPIALDIGFFQLRWYSLAYIAGIIIGWWYLANPGDIIRLWDGGMSFHGGVIGVSLAILFMAWRNKLNWLRIHDYVACTIPFGLLFGRLANFVNGELWGRPSEVPWAVIFPRADEQARHPSQLYEAGLEGIALFALLWLLFWKTDARRQPGKLVGFFLIGYGLARFTVEFFREPDAYLGLLWFDMSMGQLLTIPMLLGAIWLIATAKGRIKADNVVPAEPDAKA